MNKMMIWSGVTKFFFTDSEEVEEWPGSTQFPFVSPAMAEPNQEKAKNIVEEASNHTLKIVLHIF